MRTADPVIAQQRPVETVNYQNEPEADIAVTKSVIGDEFHSSGDFFYEITLTNNGPAVAQDVRLLDTLPDGLTLNLDGSSIIGPGGPICIPGAGEPVEITCLFPPVEPGDTYVVTLHVGIADDVAGVLTNTATGVTSTPDANPDNNSATAATTVLGADIAVTKTATSDVVVAGEEFFYEITLINNGPAPATGVHLVDTLPEGVQFIFDGSGVSGPVDALCVLGGDVTLSFDCSTAMLMPGESLVLKLHVRALLNFAGTLTNTATGDTITPDENPDNNSDTIQTAVIGADIAVTKTLIGEPVYSGGDFFYEIAVTNNGPGVAEGVVLRDVLPEAVTFIPAGSTVTGPGGALCGFTGPELRCAFPLMSLGSTFLVTLHVSVPISFAGLLTNTATVEMTTPDVNPGNESATAETTVLGADIAVTKTGSADPVLMGGDFFYEITVTNNGPAVAHEVVLSDVLPDGVTFIPAGSSVTGPGGALCGFIGPELLCTFPSMQPKAAFVITLHVGVQDTFIGVLTNTASVKMTTPDTDPDNDSDTVQTTVIGADVVVTKTVSADTVLSGGDFFYIFTITNAGTAPAENVTMRDILPAELTIIPAGLTFTGPPGAVCAANHGPPILLGCTFPPIQPGDVFVLRMQVGVAADFTGVLTNTAILFSDTPDINPDDNTDSVDITVLPPLGALDVIKVVDWNGAVPNEAVIFEICIEGPSYPDGDCQFTDWDGGTLNWTDLLPGDYLVTEIEAIGWTTTVPPDSVIVAPGETAEAYVTNTLTRGTITVTKVVDWNGVTPDTGQTFTLCIDSDLLPGPQCGGVGYAGGSVTFGDLLPGTYTVYEWPPGPGWTASGGGAVSLIAAGSEFVTITNTHDPPPPPCTAQPGDLSGFITVSGLTATGTVTNNSARDCTYPVGIASYLKFDEIIDNQQLFASNTMTVLIPAGESVTLSVAMPECATQIDLFFGDVLPTLSGERYGSRLLAALHLPGVGYCPPP